MGETRASGHGVHRQPVGLLVSDGDAATITALLGERSVKGVAMDVPELCRQIEAGTLTTAILAEPLLSRAQARRLRKALEAQPGWGDLPIVLIVDRGVLDGRPELAELGQLRLVEPPLQAAALRIVVDSALRSRWYQCQGRDFRERAVAAEEHYKQLTGTLEASVAEQIAGLKAVSERLAREVEERKRAEEQLRESEELYRYTVELSQQMVWSSDAEGRATTTGGNFYLLTGMSEGTPFEDALPVLIHPEDYDRVYDNWRNALREGRPHLVEFRMRIADGSYRAFQGRSAPRRDESGKIIRWYGFIEDITEQKKATDALRQAEERYRLASRATNDAIWDWNIVTGKVAWSDAAAAYLGTAPHEDSTIDWWEQAIHPDDRPRVVRSINAAVDSDKNRWSAAYRMRKADGDYAYVYDRGFIIRNDEGQALRAVGAVVDLTERRRAEAELRRTQAELIHVSRVSAMGTMASTLAHELNQPLTAVTSYVRGSRRLLASVDDVRARQVCEALEFAEAGALRAGQIVRRLRELVARGTVAVGAEDLKKLVEDASVLAFVDAHLYGIAHRIDIAPDARWVEVDRIQIQQVLINLIRNAVQAMQHADRREVAISTRPHSDDMVEVIVADSGSGISGSVRDALFSPFNSTKTEGLGIGLSISRTIVEAHHGKIWASDGDGGGAVFHFTLPRAEVPLDEVTDGGEIEAEQRRIV
ncbi:MAG: PAS domain-containing protein [Sphingomonadales bacterium]